MCTKLGYTISGGYDVLSKSASEFGLYSIIAYSDFAKTDGSEYKKLGMTFLRNTPPQEIWSKENKHITANLLRVRGYDQLFGTSYGRNASNEQLMIANDWLPVFDCGQRVFEFK